ncbi:MAG: PAS domain-containing sensor histidine kinase [Bacillota bacterium]|nr:PAS domain-containing sensor histidine kinase [Bacillota bacterium]
MAEESSDKELLSIFNNMPGGICVFSFIDDYPYIRVTMWNKFLEDITGFDMAEINKIGLSHVKGIAQDRDSIIKAFTKAIKKETLFKIKGRDGINRLLKFRFSTADNEKNKGCYIALVTEIKKEKNSEQDILEIKESEAVMRKVADNTLDMVAIYKPNFTRKYLTPSYKNILGYPLEEFKSMQYSDWIHPEDLNNILLFNQNLITFKKKAKCQYRAICADGRCKFLETLGKPLYNNDLLEGYIFSTRDMTERVKTEKNLKRSRKRYKTLFNNVNDAIYLNKLSKDGKPSKFIEVNNVACKRLGYTREEMKSMNIYDAIPSLTSEKISGLLEIIKNKGNALYEAYPKTRDGRIIPVEVNSIFLNVNNEKFVLSISRDITERKEKERAEEYESLRTEFFANISHELRTPVNVILSALQLTNSYTTDYSSSEAMYKKYMPVMKQNCYRLVRLINNLIDVTKIDAGYLHMNLSNENIVSLIENITLSVAQYTESQGITLIFDTNAEEKIMACDSDKIERIMLNLISNAVKFTKSGGSIFVNLKDRGDKVIISVKDTGIGISEKNQNLIFGRFIQVDKSFARNTEGSGIGLSLVKSLVEMHNGTIAVKSKLNSGSEFIITLPVCLIPSQNNNINTKDFMIQDNVEKINIEFSDIYSREDAVL